MKTKTGYTLVELMIVISITSVLVGLGISAYTRAQRRQIGQAAGEQILSLLQESQKTANIGKKDCTGKFVGQDVTITVPNTVKTQSRCEGGTLGNPEVTTIPGITFSSGYSITFNPLTYGVNLNAPSPLGITYSTTSDLIYNIEITSTGTMKYLGVQ